MSPKKLAPLYSACLLILVTLILAAVLNVLTDPNDCRILPGVHVAGVDVGGMTKKEAKAALQQIAEEFQQQDMTVLLPEETLVFSPADTQVTLHVGRAVSAAYAYGREGSSEERQAALEASRTQTYQADILPALNRQEQVILDSLERYAQQYNTNYAEASCRLDGEVPSLEEDTFQEGSQGQTLYVTLGTPGFFLDTDGLYADILAAYNQGQFQVDWSGAQPYAVPALPDADTLHQQYCTEPLDAVLDLENKTTVPSRYGHCFDVQKAKTQIRNAAPGETVALPMELIAPAKKTEDLYFQDVLGTYTSGHPQLLNYHTNLELVCQFINGTVLQPGEEFSFNDAVGERTVERGFMYGDSFTGMTRSKSAGGGVCQGSSVLHVCVLEADLEVTERAPHGLPVGYTPLGQDAAVSWGGPDFRFRNNTSFPIKIVAENALQWTKMQILGTDEKDYYIVLEATQGQSDTQLFASCYKNKYDKETNELIVRELALRSAYLRVDNE